MSKSVVATAILFTHLLAVAVAGEPERIVVIPDTHHARWVGITNDGRQFFATHPYVPAQQPKLPRTFVAIYFWNVDGSFDEALIEEFGEDVSGSESQLEKFVARELGPISDLNLTMIKVSPFQITKYGVKFGFIYVEHDGAEWIEVLPGNNVAFTPPWDGNYDT